MLVVALGYARFSNSQRILTGVRIAGVSLGGLTQGEAEQRLAEQAAALRRKQVTLKLAPKEVSVPVESLGVALALGDSTRRAFQVGRSEGFLRNVWRYARSFWLTDEQRAALRVDPVRLEQTLAQLEPRLIEDPPFPGGLVVQGTRVAVAPARAGRELSRPSAREAITTALALGRASQPVLLRASTVTPELSAGSLERARARAAELLRAPITLQSDARTLLAEPADLAPLVTSVVEGRELVPRLDLSRLDAWLQPKRAGLEAPPRDASFEVTATNEVKVVPGASGLRLVAEDVAKAWWNAARTPERRGELPLRHEPAPARTTKQAEQLHIVKLVGSFTTRHPCCQPRVENIHRIATLMDGLIVEPGQTVSVNAVVGPRTQKNGFVPAPSIEDGEMVDTVGGGVSQFATTFFNALFHAGYDIVERQPHSYWFPRYPMGHEATLSWPKPDVIFKNDSEAGLLVKTSFSATSITVKLFGDTQGRKVSSSVSARQDIVQPKVELLPNRELSPDEERVKEGGMIGWSVIASRTVTFADGSKKEEKRKVTYKPKVRRVEVHPCRIPDREPGATGEPCPVPPEEPEEAEAEPVQSE